ncbi:MAG: hypothetical protein RLN99_16450, partial [Kiloniellaceae bacterium]
MATSSPAENHAKAGLAPAAGDGRRTGRKRARQGSFARARDRWRAFIALPRDLALGKIVYLVKRPLFALPEGPWRWPGNPPATTALVPPDPWPGNAQRGTAILDDTFHFHGRSLAHPAPRWNPVGVERAWLEALHGFGWLRDLRAAGGDAARRKARALTADWIEANAAWSPVAWPPVVTGNRL